MIQHFQQNEKDNFILIEKMIATAQGNIKRGDSNQLVLWGISLSLVAILNLILYYFTSLLYASYSVWWLILPIWFVLWLIEKRNTKTQKTITYIDDVVNNAWLCVSLCLFVINVNFLLLAMLEHRYEHWRLLFPLIILLWSVGLFITGISYKFKPLMYGAAIVCLCGCGAFYIEQILQLWLVLLSAICGFLIPGIILNKQIKNL